MFGSFRFYLFAMPSLLPWYFIRTQACLFLFLSSSLLHQSFNFIHRMVLLQVDLKCAPSATSGFTGSFTVSVFLILSQYENTHTSTQLVYWVNVKYHRVSEFISFYLLNSNFQQYQKLLYTKKHSSNKFTSTNFLWDKKYHTLFFKWRREVSSIQTCASKWPHSSLGSWLITYSEVW
jgi:hypothetical protein